MSVHEKQSALDTALESLSDANKEIKRLQKRNGELTEASRKWKTKCGDMESFAKVNRDDLWYVEYLKDQLHILENMFDQQTVDISRLYAKLNSQQTALDSFDVITHRDTL